MNRGNDSWTFGTVSGTPCCCVLDTVNAKTTTLFRQANVFLGVFSFPVVSLCGFLSVCAACAPCDVSDTYRHFCVFVG